MLDLQDLYIHIYRELIYAGGLIEKNGNHPVFLFENPRTDEPGRL